MEQLGKYRLNNKLATGGMAEVFLAHAEGPMGFEKTLVVKRILPHLAENQAFVNMFLSEAKLVAQLNHPNIVQIFDFGEEAGTYFLAMEHIDGPNLRNLSRRAQQIGREIPVALSAKVISLVCEGLAYAHDFKDRKTGEPLSLVHRDISLDNILLSREGGVKVVDFGIAKAANSEHVTKTGVLKGKIAYMPPEQLRGEKLDRRADIFSLGMVFYGLLTGTRPFEATSEVSIMNAILNDEMIPVSKKRPGVPVEVQAIIDRALAKDRDERYPDCRAFQQDLERWIHSTGDPVGTYQLSELVKDLAQPSKATTQVDEQPPGASGGLSRVDIEVEDEAAPPPLEAAREIQEEMTSLAELQQESEPILLTSVRPENRPGRPAPKKNTWLLPVIGVVGLAVVGVLVGPRLLGSSATVDPDPVPELDPAPVADPPPAPVADPAPEADPPAEAKAPDLTPKARPRGRRGRRGRTKPKTKVTAVASPPVAVEKGTLEFRVRPYAVVYLDGKKLGTTPFPAVSVSVGPHKVRLVNDDLGKVVTLDYQVKSGTNILKKRLE